MMPTRVFQATLLGFILTISMGLTGWSDQERKAFAKAINGDPPQEVGDAGALQLAATFTKQLGLRNMGVCTPVPIDDTRFVCHGRVNAEYGFVYYPFYCSTLMGACWMSPEGAHAER